MVDDDMSMAYVAKKRGCGCIVGATVDTPSYCKETAKEVAAWIKDGLIVERVPIEDAKLNWHKCTHQAQPSVPALPMFPDM